MWLIVRESDGMVVKTAFTLADAEIQARLKNIGTKEKHVIKKEQ